MTERMRQGIGLLAIAAVAVVLLLPALGSEDGAAVVWRGIAGSAAVVFGLVGLGLIAAGSLRD